MANPTFQEGSLPRRKQPAEAINEHDSVLLVSNVGQHNTVAPNLADGDVGMPQLDDMGNLKVVIGDPAQVLEIAFAPINGLNKAYEGTLTAGNSPITIDFNTDTGRNAVDGWATCDGAGDMGIKFTTNGTLYGDQWTMKPGENSGIRNFEVNKIQLVHLGTDTAYRIVLI